MLKFIKIVNAQICYLTLKHIFLQRAELYFLSYFEYLYLLDKLNLYSKFSKKFFYKIKSLALVIIINILVWFLDNPGNFDLFLLYDSHSL